MAAATAAVFREDFDRMAFEKFYEFLDNFVGDADIESSTAAGPQREYHILAEEMKKSERSTLDVNFEHVYAFSADLAEAIMTQYHRLDVPLRKAVEAFMRMVAPDYAKDEALGDKRFFVAFYNLNRTTKVRGLATASIGSLVEIVGTVTRTSEVRPELLTGAYKCLECQAEVDGVAQQFKYTEPLICRNATCANRTRWHLMMERSQFVDFQRVRLQEDTTEIPAGSMPRTLDVILRHEIVDKAKPGDKVKFTGTLVVVPDVAQLGQSGGGQESVRESGSGRSGFQTEGVTGLKSLGVKELNYRLAFLSCSVHINTGPDTWISGRDADEAVTDHLDDESRRDIQDMKKTRDLYTRMAESICPTIHGHTDIKKGILLMLFGGVTKTTTEGIKLRGDVNACIVGDPSTAKSQFLKYVSEFLPRAVYTSGKASSAAGLTASVAKDPETGEFGIEAGAMLLADNGICCIDEFDKMDLKDQVAIHEAMEQQTISIAKAGIQATLNARTSVLAAANPREGRYDTSKPLKYNVDISPPIMSRFDMFFVVLDACNEISDHNIARHIVNVHRKKAEAYTVDFSKLRLQRYVQFARTIQPKLAPEAVNILADYYTRLRNSDVQGGSRSAYRITVRQLESMIRLAEALARLHCDPVVQPEYLREAHRLLSQSIIRVDEHDMSIDDWSMEYDDAEEAAKKKEEEEHAEAAAKAAEGGETEATEKKEKKEKAQPEAPKPRRLLEVTAETFNSVKQMVLLELRRHDETHEGAGMRQDDLVEWYIEQHEDITTEEQLVVQRRLVKSVIKHLHTKEGVLVEIEQPDGGAAKDPAERLFTVHPNYAFE